MKLIELHQNEAALLEAMQEHKVTAGGKTYTLEQPFFVLATQNPIEQEGTYPLPEAQLDRFMFNLLIKYPTQTEEVEIVKSNTSLIDNKLKNAISKDELALFQNLILDVPVADNVIEFAVKSVANTRPGKDSITNKRTIRLGSRSKGKFLSYIRAKARALLDGRTTPDIDDVKSMIKPVLRHRIIPNFNAEADGISKDMILDQLIELS